MHTKLSAEDKPEQSKPDITSLPDEVLLKVFSNLNPKDLSQCAQVNRKWNNLAMDGSLWTNLYPVSWAQGIYFHAFTMPPECTCHSISVNKIPLHSYPVLSVKTLACPSHTLQGPLKMKGEN